MSFDNSDFSHLSSSVRHVLELSSEERVSWIERPRWIGYSTAQKALGKLESLLNHAETHRMPNLLLLGNTNNGKTSIIRRFASLHEPDDSAMDGNIKMPVVMIQMPPLPDESRFYEAILDRLFTPYRAREPVSSKQRQVIRILKNINTRMLIVDEMHHMLAGRQEKQRTFLNVIKFIGNELMIPIVGVGTKEALRGIQIDPQLANRFQPFPIPQWQLNRDFQKLLASFEALIPLKQPSKLHSRELAAKLHAFCEGSIGELSSLLNVAAVEAMNSGKECISSTLLDQIDWIIPSKRRTRASEMLNY